MAGAESGYLFPIPEGQNSAIKRFASDLRKGRFSTKTKKWNAVGRGETYRRYMNALGAVQELMPNSKIDELEMLLFGMSSRLVRQLSPSPRWQCPQQKVRRRKSRGAAH
jgi:hypothetical protein